MSKRKPVDFDFRKGKKNGVLNMVILFYVYCKKEFTTTLHERHRKYCSNNCAHLGRRGTPAWNKDKKCPQWSGEKHGMWKGGRRKSRGYVILYRPDHPFNNNNFCLEHRLNVESLIGRYLLPTEQVHHINKIKDDNRPQNLMAFANDRAHKRFERGGEVKPSEIIFDGRLI
jgi:hypothetical protein